MDKLKNALSYRVLTGFIVVLTFFFNSQHLFASNSSKWTTDETNFELVSPSINDRHLLIKILKDSCKPYFLSSFVLKAEELGDANFKYLDLKFGNQNAIRFRLKDNSKESSLDTVRIVNTLSYDTNNDDIELNKIISSNNITISLGGLSTSFDTSGLSELHNNLLSKCKKEKKHTDFLRKSHATRICYKKSNDYNEKGCSKLALNGDEFAQYELSRNQDSLDKALKMATKSAENGNKQAQRKLIKAYSESSKIKKDDKKAFYWATKHAENKGIQGKSFICAAYYNGIGVDKNLNKALKACLDVGNTKMRLEDEDFTRTTAFNKALTKSMRILVHAYKYGNGVPKNPSREVHWIKKIAELGNENALFELALRYLIGGDGVIKNSYKSFEILNTLKSSNKPYVHSFLGRLYLSGEGVDQDLVNAHMHFNISISQQDNIEVREMLEETEKLMSNKDMSKAMSQASEWMETNSWKDELSRLLEEKILHAEAKQ